MFCVLNTVLRRRRRRLVTLVAVLAVTATVVVAHSAMNHDHMADLGGAVVMCLAVAETAVVAAGAAISLSALMRRPLFLIAPPELPEPAFVVSPIGVRARAGPALLQNFQL